MKEIQLQFDLLNYSTDTHIPLNRLVIFNLLWELCGVSNQSLVVATARPTDLHQHQWLKGELSKLCTASNDLRMVSVSRSRTGQVKIWPQVKNPGKSLSYYISASFCKQIVLTLTHWTLKAASFVLFFVLHSFRYRKTLIHINIAILCFIISC